MRQAEDLGRQLKYRDNRRKLLKSFFDTTTGAGLEIGPLHAGMVNPDEANVRFADVYDRKGLCEKYALDKAVALELIPEIDFPLIVDGVEQSLSEATAMGAPYDWVLASHVVEHVADLIGWLNEIEKITSPGSRLILFVPDRRYCFDVHRPQTTIGQILEAHENKDTKPGIRAVYDYFGSKVEVDTAAVWKGARPPGRASRTYGLDEVTARLEDVRRGEYHDVHVWTFTPQSFLEQIKILRQLGLISWYVKRIEPTKRNRLEFKVELQRVPEDVDASIAEPELDSDLPDWLEDLWAAKDEARRLRKERDPRATRVGKAILKPLRKSKRFLVRTRARFSNK